MRYLLWSLTKTVLRPNAAIQLQVVFEKTRRTVVTGAPSITLERASGATLSPGPGEYMVWKRRLSYSVAWVSPTVCFCFVHSSKPIPEEVVEDDRRVAAPLFPGDMSTIFVFQPAMSRLPSTRYFYSLLKLIGTHRCV